MTESGTGWVGRSVDLVWFLESSGMGVRSQVALPQGCHQPDLDRWDRQAIIICDAWFQASDAPKKERSCPATFPSWLEMIKFGRFPALFWVQISNVFLFCIFFETNAHIRSLYVENDQIWNILKKFTLEGCENSRFVFPFLHEIYVSHYLGDWPYLEDSHQNNLEINTWNNNWHFVSICFVFELPI